MKKLLFAIILGGTCFSASPQNKTGGRAAADTQIIINAGFSKAAAFDSILKKYAPFPLPGISLAIYTEAEGWWTTTAGYADVKKKIPMQQHHLQYLQSVSKMYMAVAILQLAEQRKIDLNAFITKYLPEKYSRYVRNADRITVRMLLNHTSGIREYNEDAEFISNVILHPLRNFPAEECLQAIEGKEPESEPGARYRYVNTNYLLLSLIGDAISGDHAEYIKRHIFKPLGLKNSYYGKSYDYLKGLPLPQSYWDVFNNGIPVEITPFQQVTVACSKGDDGIVSTTTDALLFLKSVMEGKLLQPASLNEMLNWVKDDKGNRRYGMGMIYFDLGGIIAYGHGGGGIGAGCALLYVPDKKTYLFFSTNLGVFADGKLPAKAGEMRDEILKLLLQ